MCAKIKSSNQCAQKLSSVYEWLLVLFLIGYIGASTYILCYHINLFSFCHWSNVENINAEIIFIRQIRSFSSKKNRDLNRLLCVIVGLVSILLRIDLSQSCKALSTCGKLERTLIFR